MKSFFCLALSFLLAYGLYAQETEETEIPSSEAFVIVSREPKPLNMDEIKQKIAYPKQAKEAYIQGMVTVRILIDEKGNYMQHKVVKSPHSILTEAVEKYIPELKFSPAEQKGKPIKFWMNVPFQFVLTGDEDPLLDRGYTLRNYQGVLSEITIERKNSAPYAVKLFVSPQCTCSGYEIEGKELTASDLKKLNKKLSKFYPDIQFSCTKKPSPGAYSTINIK